MCGLLFGVACKKEADYYYDPENPLTLSDDTVKFDTVFTTLGSTTRRVKIFNRSKDDVTISEILLEGGNTSAYQLNINGVPANKLSNFRIKGRDSVNLFVRVNIDPNAENTPFVVSDSIRFATNGKIQRLQLQAFGQNARFINGLTLNSNTVWDKSLPYVIYSTVKVPENITLLLSKGARVYFHKDAKLEVAGTLKVQGIQGDSVTIASDRKERIYSEVPGQWDGIHFLKTSKDNEINYATIKNALIGLQIDSPSVNSGPKLLLTNSIVKNMEVVAVLGYNTSIVGLNNLFLNSGKHLVYCAKGGDYNFKQNTFCNNFIYSARVTPSLFFSDMLTSTSGATLKLSLVNNIIWGNNANELELEKKGNSFTQSITSNLIRTKDASLTAAGNLLNTDPLFMDTNKLNFSLLSTSPASNKGANLSTDPYFQSWLAKDQKGKERIFPSELGCYEIF